MRYTVKTLNLDLDTVERLQKASVSKGQSMSQIVRDALAAYFDRTTAGV